MAALIPDYDENSAFDAAANHPGLGTPSTTCSLCSIPPPLPLLAETFKNDPIPDSIPGSPDYTLKM